jgi:serine protease
MKTRLAKAALFAAALSLFGCGYTVGDSCTTSSECGNQLCLNQENTPGGYCSLLCPDNKCPNGSSCIPSSAAPTTGEGFRQSACFHNCRTSNDCRPGYQCALSSTGSSQSVCIGPFGF